MRKFTIMKYVGDDSRRMTDILDDLYFAAQNWESYTKYNLPTLITNQWQKYKDKTGGFINKGMIISKVNMHFIDSFNLTGPVVNTIELELGDSRHIARLWTSQGLKYDPEYKDYERLIKRAGVAKNKAFVVMILTKDTEAETWNRLYDALDKNGLEFEVHYHTEAIYEVEEEM